MFINSLSLIVHTTLLNTMMPTSVFFVFKRYLYFVRLISTGLTYDISGTQNSELSIYLQTSDYFDLFTDNLELVGILTVTLAVVWAILAVLDQVFERVLKENYYILGWSSGSKREPIWNNFALRFFYELFLEFCICAMLNISIHSSEWVLGMIVLMAIAVYLAWLVSLFFKNGPYLEGFYDNGTAWSSLWSPRPFADDFNAINKVKEMRKAKRKALHQARKEQKKNRTNSVAPQPMMANDEKFVTEQPPTDRPLIRA